MDIERISPQACNIMWAAMALLEAERENRLQRLREQFSTLVQRPNARCTAIVQAATTYIYEDGVRLLYSNGTYLQRAHIIEGEVIQWVIEVTPEGSLVTVVNGPIRTEEVPYRSPPVVDGKVCP